MSVLVRFSGMGFYTGFETGTGFAIRARARRALDQCNTSETACQAFLFLC